MKESDFQKDCIDAIRKIFPDCIVMKNDAGYVQGIPDFSVVVNGHCAFLEFKDSIKATHRPNQDYYVNKLNDWHFSSFVYPENWGEVFDNLKKYLSGGEGNG